MPITFKIWAERKDGTQFMCFDWCRDEASGIMRAHADAAQFGIELVKVWAVPVETRDIGA